MIAEDDNFETESICDYKRQFTHYSKYFKSS